MPAGAGGSAADPKQLSAVRNTNFSKMVPEVKCLSLSRPFVLLRIVDISVLSLLLPFNGVSKMPVVDFRVRGFLLRVLVGGVPGQVGSISHGLPKFFCFSSNSFET